MPQLFHMRRQAGVGLGLHQSLGAAGLNDFVNYALQLTIILLFCWLQLLPNRILLAEGWGFRSLLPHFRRLLDLEVLRSDAPEISRQEPAAAHIF